MALGEPFRAVLHSADASAGVAIPMYTPASGSGTRTLAANEILEITQVFLVSAAGGDCYVTVGANATVQPYLTVLRGTFAANGGADLHMEDEDPWVASAANQTPFLTAPAGAVDVMIIGRIRKQTTEGVHPSWKEGR